MRDDPTNKDHAGMSIDVERLRQLDEAATTGELSTAERQTAEEIIECPICEGHGEVLAADYCNIDGKALGVQFYGIGSEFGAHEALWSYLRNAVPSILAMAEENARLREALESIADHNKVREWTATLDNPETHWVTRDGFYALIARTALKEPTNADQ